MKKFLILLTLTLIFQVTREGCMNSVPKFTQEFNLTNLTLYLVKNGCKHVDIVIRQATLETGYFQSEICQDQHNYFGMKHPKIRLTTSIGEKRSHAVYTNWQKSALDYIIWQKYAPENREQYLKLLQLCYSQDPYYVWKLNRMKVKSDKGEIKIILKS